MADDDDESCVLIVEDEVFQPVDGLDVEVVRRLVEHDDVGLAEQGLREEHLHLQARVGIAHEVVVQLDRDAETLQEFGGVGFGLPAVQLGKLGLQFAGAEAVFLGEVLFFIEGVLLLHDIVEVLVAHDDGVEDGVFVVLELILLEDGHTRAGLEEDIAGRRLQFAGEHFQKGGFAGAVRADDAVAVAGCELQVDLLEQNAAAELHAEVGNCDHSLLLILIYS